MYRHGNKFYLILSIAFIRCAFKVHAFLSPRNLYTACHKNNKRNDVGNKEKVLSQEEIDSLMIEMGLKTVNTKTNKQKQQKPKTAASSKDESKYTPLSLRTQLQYARKGHCCIRNAIPPNTLLKIKKDLVKYSSKQELASWQQKVEVALELSTLDVCKKYSTIEACRNVLEKQALDGRVEIPFLQHFNTWRSIPSVKNLIIGDDTCNIPLLAKHAKVLLDVKSIRLYQDSLFHKRENDGPTPFHSDARMAPFDTSKMITFWIPLDHIPSFQQGGTGLYFVTGSHSDFALPYWNKQDDDEYSRLEERYGGDGGIEDYMPMDVGDVTAHSGWTLHGASAGGERYALAVTYVDAKAEIREDALDSIVGHMEDERSYKDWIRDVNPRAYFEHDLVPIVLRDGTRSI